MSNKNNVKDSIILLSDILTLDDKHQEAYLCSTQYLWNKKSLKDEAKSGLPIKFRVIQNNINQFSASGIFTKSQLKNFCIYYEEVARYESNER